MPRHYLERLFEPRAVAVIGASDKEDTAGNRVLRNLKDSGFEGSIYPVNPHHRQLLGERSYRSIADTPRPVDLAVISTPTHAVADVVRECGEHGVSGLVILTAGIDRDGALERRILDHARQYRMHVIGPNCLGIMRPRVGLNATFSRNQAASGGLALVSQSGALVSAILDWAQARNIGFSLTASLGNASDADFGDLLDYLATDASTRAILLYVEGIRDSRRFMSGLRAAARVKPVIVVKAGRRPDGSRAALSHSGALVGSDQVFEAALARAGGIRVHTVEQLFSAAEILSKGFRLRGKRLCIVTDGGGPAVIASDHANEIGVGLAELSPGAIERLDATLPRHWSRTNPVDLLEDATPERYRDALAVCLQEDGVDAVLAMLVPQAMTEPEQIAQTVIDAASETRKPVLACWMGDAQVREARHRFSDAGIPHFETPEASIEAFAALDRYQANHQLLVQVPGPAAFRPGRDVDGPRLIMENALTEGRDLLTNLESKAVLRAFDIPVVRTIEARTASEALVVAESLGYPLAMKVSSPTLTHKSDFGGVRLDVADAQQVRRAYDELIEAARTAHPDALVSGVTLEPMQHRIHGRELMVGISTDPVFGPVVNFGGGGTAVELVNDVAVALPPLNDFLADQLMARPRVARLLTAYRELPAVDMAAVRNVLLQVSEMVCALPHIRELDINPLIADESGVVAVDARIRIASPGRGADRYGHLAVHPYPSHLVKRTQLPDGTDIVIRPIRPEDAERERAFIDSLSPEAKYYRFMENLRELSPAMLARFTQIDYDRELALIAVRMDGLDEAEQLGVARYNIDPDGETCEFALVVADTVRRQGLGTRLMMDLMESARARGLREIHGDVLSENRKMLKLMRQLGFAVLTSPDDAGVKRVTRDLR
ncbi:bifunctional acetate--CoA ligase family protein/GNAT family N-acetyltransferase [Ectothiorhodospiraceae bacterium WFHF3C12]|nr:bifunctional acetate--CoA ligase family protein/GNAT family N-acetyltransferase [Ectothiorhodospiraceae bacterium WFHF3C12]